jgi:hypothetical protein
MYDRAGAYLPRFIVCLATVAFAAVILSFFLRSDGANASREQELSSPETAVSFES